MITALISGSVSLAQRGNSEVETEYITHLMLLMIFLVWELYFLEWECFTMILKRSLLSNFEVFRNPAR